jgi:hypothetical protein
LAEQAEKRRTVADALADARTWRAHVEQDGEKYGEAWKERAFERIARREAGLRRFEPDMLLLDWHEALNSPLLSDEEKWVIRWQHKGSMFAPSAFEEAFYDLIEVADDENLDRLAQGWPLEVRALRGWRNGDMASRLRTLPLDFDI